MLGLRPTLVSKEKRVCSSINPVFIPRTSTSFYGSPGIRSEASTNTILLLSRWPLHHPAKLSRISAASRKAETCHQPATNLQGLSITNKLTNREAWGLGRPALVEAESPCLTPLAIKPLGS